MNNKNKVIGYAGVPSRPGRLVLALSGLAASSSALALPTVEFDNGLVLQSQITANYTLSVRTASPSSEYLADLNNDDGTRNFDKGSLINNRLSLFGEIIARKDNYGAVLRGSHFYDDVYKSSNDNDAPLTVNKTGDHREFTSRARKDSGSKARLLDAYVFGDFPLGEQQYLSVKAGRHLLAWGESLFWPNISQGQAPVDATKFNVPGTEAKDAYLPVGQVSAAWSLNEQLTLTGFYQYEWERTLLNPVGDYFGSDYFGPGAQFYRLAPGVISSLPDTTFTALTYAGDDKPRDSGQWGVGLRYSPTFSTEFGLYHYRYHDRVAAMFFDFTGTTRYSSAPGLDGLGYGPGVPSYKFGYFEDIKLTGLSFTTKYRDVQIGGDMSLRQDAPVYLSNGAPTTGDLLMTNLNFMYMLGPNRFAHQTTLMGELLNERIQRVDTLQVSGGGAGIDGAYDDFEYDGQTRSSTLLGLGAYFDYPGLFSGWDLNTRVVWMQTLDGSGTQGLGRDEKRLTLGADFKYLGNFQVGATLVNYLSSPSIEHGRLLADRDYLSFNVKYTF